MEANTFCIPIKVEDEQDLYDRFLPSGLAFSSELLSYLEDQVVDRKVKEKIRLELFAPQSPDMDHFRNTYQTFIEKLIRRNKREIRLSDLKTILFLVLGLIFVSIGLLLSGKVGPLLAEIISAVGSFAMWSAASVFIETLPTLRHKDKLLKQFAKAEICYCRFDNSHM